MECPEFSEYEKHGGMYAVRELSPRAQRGAASRPDLVVYEYQASNTMRALPTSWRYCIKWDGGNWQAGLLKPELEFILERFCADADRKEIEDQKREAQEREAQENIEKMEVENNG